MNPHLAATAVPRPPDPAREPAAPATAYVGDSASVQQLLDQVRAAGGGTARLPAGRFRLDRPLEVPPGVCLAGAWEAPHHAMLDSGTVFEVFAGHGDEDGPPLLLLNPASAVRGITFFYPRRRVPDAVAYPWTIRGRGMHNSVLDCTFANPWQALDFAAEANELHHVRNCFGCPLKTGIRVDRCTDIGRIENVHFNAHYWMRCGAEGVPAWPQLPEFVFENLVAFDFARTDWEYVLNTFCYGARIGYRFPMSADGPCNGNFLGIGADWCAPAVLVEESQPPGLLITNGEFVGGKGAPVMLEIAPSHTGVVQLSNCSFWGPCGVAALVDGRGYVSFQQCSFLNQMDPPAHAIQARGGRISIQNCRFGIDGPDVLLTDRLASAVILGNHFTGGIEVANRCGARLEMGFNTSERPVDPAPTPQASRLAD